MSELYKALAKAQAEMKNAPLNKTNPHFKSKYADLAAIRDAIIPALSKNGLALTQTTDLRDGTLVLVTRLHLGDEVLEGVFPLPPTGKMQEFGSALTYARRYSLAALVGIAADEDDGNAAETPVQTKRQSAAKQAAEKAEASRPKFQAMDGEPQAIGVPPTEDGKGSDWRTWAGLLVTTLEAQNDLMAFEAWIRANSAATGKLADANAKLHGWLLDRIEKRRALLSQAPQEAAA